MGRRLSTLAAVVSLVVCATGSLFWARSHWRDVRLEQVWRSYDGDALHTRAMHWRSGKLYLVRTTWQRGGPPATSYSFADTPPASAEEWEAAETWWGFGRWPSVSSGLQTAWESKAWII